MCGISGFWTKRPAHADSVDLRAMTDALRHRGPDDSGYWLDQAAGVALGHRRLSILDLSPEGHQPMTSASGRFVMTFNGEVFNYAELRRDLGEHAWRGHSDTEVILLAIETWGLSSAVQRFIGMFAFALWDRELRRLLLVRDRLGIKPLYYGSLGGRFFFASELKALTAHPQFVAEVDRDSVALLMRHNYIPAPYSIYKGVAKLRPGTILEVNSPAEWDEPQPYWSARGVAERGLQDPFRGTDVDAVEQLDRLLRDAVRLRMISDVPIGAFLSGGIDSSAVVALMQAQSSRPVKTFSIGFEQDEFDEAPYARAVARHLGTDHTEMYVSAAQALEAVPRLPTVYDEPFADSSQIPTLLLSELTRRHVTVSLSGDGGDELFAGYTRYPWTLALWQKTHFMPRPMRRAAARALLSLSPSRWDALVSALRPALSSCGPISGDRIHKFASLLANDSPQHLYRSVLSHWDDPARLVLGSSEPATEVSDSARWAEVPGLLEKMMLIDLVSYLPDDILAKVDRASMTVALEARVPILDHRVVEFAWTLPATMKLRDGRGKWLLRQLLYRYVPRPMLERPKMGFGVPLAEWLRGPLRDWAEDLLSEDRLRREGMFAPELVRTKWLEHLSGRRNWHYWLWNVLMFQAWQETATRTQEMPAGISA